MHSSHAKVRAKPEPENHFHPLGVEPSLCKMQNSIALVYNVGVSEHRTGSNRIFHSYEWGQ